MGLDAESKSSVVRARVAERLRRVADRLSPETAFRSPGLSFTIEPNRGLVLHDNGTNGCGLWYRTQDYDRAFSE